MFICKCNKFCFTFIQMCFVASQLFLQIPIHCLFLSRRLSKTNPKAIPGLNSSATWIVRYYGQSYRMPSESLKIYQVEFDLNLNFDTQKMFGLILLALQNFFSSSETQNNYDKECPVSLNNYTVVYMLFFSTLLILKLGHNYKYSPLHKF